MPELMTKEDWDREREATCVIDDFYYGQDTMFVIPDDDDSVMRCNIWCALNNEHTSNEFAREWLNDNFPY